MTRIAAEHGVCACVRRARRTNIPRAYVSIRPMKSFSGASYLHSRTWRPDVAAKSFFGVGAPEALLVGVVALVVFGPQGLIEAAKSVANTIRSLQPTVQEFTRVSSDLRTTITKDIGLDELQREFQDIQRTSQQLTPWKTSSPAATPPWEPPASIPQTLTSSESKDAAVNQKSTAEADSAEASFRASRGGSAAAPTVSLPGDARGNGGNAGTAVAKGFDDEERASLSEIAASLSAMEDAKRTKREADSDGRSLDDMRAESAKLAGWSGPVPATPASTTGAVGTGASRVSNGELDQSHDTDVPKRLRDMTLAELEAELERRRSLIKAIENL